MKTKLLFASCFIVHSFLILSVFAQGTAFTYQGRLNDNGNPASGNYDLRFTIYDATSGGATQGVPLTNSATAISNGLFTVSLDFGNQFPGADRWLEIAVRTNGGELFKPLTPRQSITATPYALYSPSAGTAVSVSDAVPAAQVSGVLPTAALPANVALRNANQTFTGGNLFSGPVGINTTNTIQVLTVGQAETPLNGGSQVGVYDAGQAFIVTRQTTADVEATFGVDSAAGVVSVLTDHPLVFRAGNGAIAGNVEYLRIARGGNVGIRTFTPASALEVNGTVTASGFSGNGEVPWQTVAGTSQQAQPNHGYLLTNDALVTLTLPASPNPGDVVRVSGTGAAAWRISQNVGQSVLVKNIPGNIGSVWTPRGSYRDWNSVASSGDGSKLVAAVNGGQIYTSTDSGVSWTPRAISGLIWKSVASSADGSKLVAVPQGSQIYTSTDSGVNWTARESNRNWYSVASSADGSKLVAVVYDGWIYTSTGSGVSWTARDSSRGWWSVASSADGNKLVAVPYNGPIYTSTDSGVSWTARDSSRGWISVASSADGLKLVAVVYDGWIYTSTDSGVSWTPRESNREWSFVASSADGSKLVAIVNGRQIYTSTDSGVNWTPRDSSRLWWSVASSADGLKFVAVVLGGQIYTSAPESTSSTSGYLLGDQGSALELQYVGNGQFLPLSFTGNILAY